MIHNPKHTAPKVGLVLGGGGARGLAHIGVLKVLEAEQIPVHLIAGASMGGVLAAFYAAGMSPAEMEAESLELAKPRRLLRMLDFSAMHKCGLLQGLQLAAWLEEHLQNRTFADLRIPLALSSTDLLRGVLAPLKTGQVSKAVMATCAVPGVFPPVEWEGMLLADGALLNNLPADVLREMGAQALIVVDVAPHFPREIPLGETKLPDVLPGLPDVADALYQAMLIMSSALTERHLSEAHPEAILRPDLPDDFSVFMGFNRAAEAIQAGEDCARAALPLLREACGMRG